MNQPLKWIEELLKEVADFEADLYPPREKKIAEDVVVGTCPLELKRLWTFCRHCEREIDQLKLDMKYASPGEADEIRNRISLVQIKKEAADYILIGCLNEFFDQWKVLGHLHVKQEWEVVRCGVNHRSASIVPGIFRQLFDGYPESEG